MLAESSTHTLIESSIDNIEMEKNVVELQEASTIKIFARVRPVNRKLKFNPSRYKVEPSLGEEDPYPKLTFHIPKDEAQGLINNSKEDYDFRFDRIFDTDTKQEEIFDNVAKPVVERYPLSARTFSYC